MERGARHNVSREDLGNHRPVSLWSLQGIRETTGKYKITECLDKWATWVTMAFANKSSILWNYLFPMDESDPFDTPHLDFQKL